MAQPQCMYTTQGELKCPNAPAGGQWREAFSEKKREGFKIDNKCKIPIANDKCPQPPPKTACTNAKASPFCMTSDTSIKGCPSSANVWSCKAC